MDENGPAHLDNFFIGMFMDNKLHIKNDTCRLTVSLRSAAHILWCSSVDTRLFEAYVLVRLYIHVDIVDFLVQWLCSSVLCM